MPQWFGAVLKWLGTVQFELSPDGPATAALFWVAVVGFPFVIVHHRKRVRMERELLAMRRTWAEESDEGPSAVMLTDDERAAVRVPRLSVALTSIAVTLAIVCSVQGAVYSVSSKQTPAAATVSPDEIAQHMGVNSGQVYPIMLKSDKPAPAGTFVLHQLLQVLRSSGPNEWTYSQLVQITFPKETSRTKIPIEKVLILRFAGSEPSIWMWFSPKQTDLLLLVPCCDAVRTVSEGYDRLLPQLPAADCGTDHQGSACQRLQHAVGGGFKQVPVRCTGANPDLAARRDVRPSHDRSRWMI